LISAHTEEIDNIRRYIAFLDECITACCATNDENVLERREQKKLEEDKLQEALVLLAKANQL